MKRLFSTTALVVGVIICFYTTASSQVSREWVSHFDGKGAVDEIASAMTTDAAGNVYVTGSMPPTGGTFSNAITIKLNKFGSILWRERYTSKYGSAYGKAIAVDGAGNVYVAGYTRGPFNSDFLLIKYSASGDTLWTRKRNGPENDFDEVSGIVINAAGNIWVTGISGVTSTDNIMTVIYDAAGNELALLSYSVSLSSKEHVNAIATDATGNVYITGYTYTTQDFASHDALTLKYSTVGSLMWAKIYTGIINNYDHGNQVAVDLLGNVYVTGMSARTIQNSIPIAFTIKYTSLGDTVWVRRFEGGLNGAEGNAIAADVSGNVYMTGTTREYTSAVLIVKYTAAGDTVWTRSFDGNGTITGGKAIGLDISGNVFVCGNSNTDIIILKYSPAGTKLWNQSYNGSLSGTDQLVCLNVSPSGNSTIAGLIVQPTSGDDIVTARFDSAGTMAWESIYQSSGNSGDEAKKCTVNKDGNLFIAGSARFDVYEEIVTIKYDMGGDTVWARRYSAAFGANPKAIAVDKRGNVYVTGISYNAGGGYQSANFVTLKYDPNGILKWAVSYDNGSTDYPNAIALDNNGNVYITGESMGSGGSDYVTLKYDSSGTQMWFPKRYNASGGTGNDQAYDVVVDTNGSVYVTGMSDALAGDPMSGDIATIKYNAAGIQQWVRRYSGSSTTPVYDKGTRIAIDDSGNVYVGGSVNDEKGLNMIVIKYNTTGDTQWTARYDGPAQGNDELHDLALDHDGNTIVTGASAGMPPTYDYDYATVKFNPNGVMQWEARYDDGNNGQESASSLAVDLKGNVYVTGSGNDGHSWLGNGQYKNIVTIRYSPTGTEDWEAIYQGAANISDIGNSISIDTSGNIYVAGASVEYHGNYGDANLDMTVIKYHQDVSASLYHNSLSIPDEFSLSQNFPNPFNPSTSIRYSIPSSSRVRLIIYTMLGQEVQELVNEVQNAGWKEVRWNAHIASGMYIYQLTAFATDNPNKIFVQSNKLLLLK
jgi:uncharacterized delta-60 repeat protein